MILPLRIEELTFVAGGRTLIDRVSLELEAGPSTHHPRRERRRQKRLMRLMHGLLAPTSGRVLWNAEGARRCQAMVFQRPVMLRRSALANVAYALKVSGSPQAERMAMDALEEVGLAHVARHPARVLSGGDSSGSRWRGPGRCIRRCCSWTSLPPISTPAPREKSRP